MHGLLASKAKKTHNESYLHYHFLISLNYIPPSTVWKVSHYTSNPINYQLWLVGWPQMRLTISSFLHGLLNMQLPFAMFGYAQEDKLRQLLLGNQVLVQVHISVSMYDDQLVFPFPSFHVQPSHGAYMQTIPHIEYQQCLSRKYLNNFARQFFF